MLTDKDILKIIEAHKKIFYTREEAVSKKDFDNLRADFRTLQTAVDKLVVTLQKYFDEQKVLVHKINRMEEWIKKAANKLGVEYPF